MTSKIYIEDINIIKKYINENLNSLGDIEREILQLETHSEDTTLQKELKRKIINIGRGASFFGLSALVKVTYEMKYNMEIIGRLSGNGITERIDNLLLGLDFLRSYTDRLEKVLQDSSIPDKEFDNCIEFTTTKEEDQIIESLEINHKNIELEAEKHIDEEANNNTCDVLLSESFRSGMADDIREQFIFENVEHIELIENNILIRLDNDKTDMDAINEIFRAAHSIKGGGSLYLGTLSADDSHYYDTKKFLDVVHSFESLLTLVRDKQCNFEKNLVDLSLLVIDFLKTYMQLVVTGEGSINNHESIIEDINREFSNIQSIQVNPSQNISSTDRNKEDKLEDARAKSNMTQSIRVRQDKIDTMMNLISELVIAKNSFAHLTDKLNMEYHLPEISKEIKQVGAYVNRISDELQNSIMSVRMVEIKTIFQKMPRVVRDIAQNSGKTIELIMEGEDTEIDKSIIEHISDPLVHIIRNAADHGIETQGERLALGKPGTGKIILRAYNKNKYVYIEVEDDGKGIDPDKIKEKAIDKGIISSAEADRMSRNQLINLIFAPGFSMAGKITEVSGRGVGMDIVKSNISKINGSITVESEVSRGTKMIIRLPLSLAISHGLIVEVEGSNYIIPLESIVETVKIDRSNIHNFNDKYFTYLRGNVIGLEWLSKILLLGDRKLDKEELNAVILTNGADNFAVVVDRLRNEQEFVIKPLEGHLSSIPGISGSTILGDGQVVLILNPSDLVKLAGM